MLNGLNLMLVVGDLLLDLLVLGGLLLALLELLLVGLRLEKVVLLIYYSNNKTINLLILSLI